MLTPQLYLVLFWEDVIAFGALVAPALAIMAVPALPVALLAWIIGERVGWRTVVAGTVVAWLSGAVGILIAFPMLSGIAIVYRDWIGDEPLKYHDIDRTVTMLLSPIAGCCCAYLATLRYNRWVFDRQRNGRASEPSPRRKFSFSLRTLLIAQLLLLAVMGLWLAARRPSFELYLRWKAWEDARTQGPVAP